MSSSGVPQEGTLNAFRFPRLLAALDRRGFTGVLQATTPCLSPARTSGQDEEEAGTTREIHFRSGHIAWAVSTDERESLKAALLDGGDVSPRQWAEAEEAARRGTLRESLLELKLLSEERLAQVDKKRIEQIVLALFHARVGEYKLREHKAPPGIPNVDLRPVALILQGAMEGADPGLIAQEVGPLDARYRIKPGAAEDRLLVDRGEFQTILKLLDGENSVADICSLTSLPETFIRSILAGLHLAEIIEPVGVTAADTAAAPAEMAAAARPARRPGASVPVDAGESVHTPQAFPAEPPVVPVLPRKDRGRAPGADPLERVQPAEPGEAVASVYAAADPHQGSRPWLFLGSGLAVGLAAVLLILLSQDRGDAVVLSPSAASSQARTGGISPDAARQDGPYGDTRRAASPAPSPGPTSSAPTHTGEPHATRDLAVTPDPGNSSRDNSARTDAWRDLLSGRYAAAAARFGHSLSGQSGMFTIQLVLACRDATIRRFVDEAGPSDDLFILPAPFQGRSCYRVYWGRYATRKLAREALRHDLPADLRSSGAKAWITRLGNS